MKIPRGLEPLIEDGIIDAVIRPLKSGKEASVYVVACGAIIRCAKVYKEAEKRGFHKLAEYQEGRRARRSVVLVRGTMVHMNVRTHVRARVRTYVHT